MTSPHLNMMPVKVEECVWAECKVGHLRVGQGDFKGSNVLRDASSLSGCHCRLPQGIQQRRLHYNGYGSAN